MEDSIDLSPRRAARIAGIGYLLIFALAIFANFFVVTGLVEHGDAATTTANIMESEGLFRAGLISFLAVFVLDVVIAWALYVLFRPAGRDLSLLTAWFRLVYTGFLGVGLIFFFRILLLVSGADYLSAFDPAQTEAQVMLALEAFDATWMIGLAAFGLHLVLLGTMVLRTTIPRLLGYVLIVAGAAYVLDTVARGTLASYGEYEDVFLAIVAIPSVVGELWLALWLLIRGGKDELVPSSG